MTVLLCHITDHSWFGYTRGTSYRDPFRVAFAQETSEKHTCPAELLNRLTPGPVEESPRAHYRVPTAEML